MLHKVLLSKNVYGYWRVVLPISFHSHANFTLISFLIIEGSDDDFDNASCGDSSLVLEKILIKEVVVGIEVVVWFRWG